MIRRAPLRWLLQCLTAAAVFAAAPVGAQQFADDDAPFARSDRHAGLVRDLEAPLTLTGPQSAASPRLGHYAPLDCGIDGDDWAERPGCQINGLNPLFGAHSEQGLPVSLSLNAIELAFPQFKIFAPQIGPPHLAPARPPMVVFVPDVFVLSIPSVHAETPAPPSVRLGPISGLAGVTVPQILSVRALGLLAARPIAVLAPPLLLGPRAPQPAGPSLPAAILVPTLLATSVKAAPLALSVSPSTLSVPAVAAPSTASITGFAPLVAPGVTIPAVTMPGIDSAIVAPDAKAVPIGGPAATAAHATPSVTGVTLPEAPSVSTPAVATLQLASPSVNVGSPPVVIGATAPDSTMTNRAPANVPQPGIAKSPNAPAMAAAPTNLSGNSVTPSATPGVPIPAVTTLSTIAAITPPSTTVESRGWQVTAATLTNPAVNVATPPFTPSVAAPDVVVPGLVGAAAAPPPPSLAYPMMVPANGEGHFAAVAGPAKPLGNLSHAAPVAGGQTYHSGMAPEGLPPGVSAPAALMIIGLIRPNHPAASLALIPNLITAGSTGFEAPRSAAPGLVTASIAAPVLTAPGIVPASARPPINRIAWINPVVLVPVITSSPGALVPAVTVPNVWLPTIAVPSVIVTASSINGVNASISVSVVLHGTH